MTEIQNNPRYPELGDLEFDSLPVKHLGELTSPRTAGFQIIMRKSALDYIHHHGNSTPRIEVCGVLVGNVYRDQDGPFLLIEHVVAGVDARGSAGNVTFTAKTWEHIQRAMDKTYPHLKMVGWYHTHPGHGVFLSQMDMFIHSSFFSLPWQAALVYDPQRRETGIFEWNDGKADACDFPVEVRPSDEDAQNAAAQPPFRRSKRRPRFAMKAAVALFAMGLFAAMGYLLGLLFLSLHIQLPKLPLH